ncbi:hypothetical protein [Paraburkholderia sp.]|uniref:hypothetical protein n=1 Tax=Paraburkholderia sp. TaxID=1926495 RepID=UPI00238B4AEF|nr:hypothetical protein [Paraburkholderia sp.]MDE1183977.1 hypothetical protein [Paraburkholderia sp.]
MTWPLRRMRTVERRDVHRAPHALRAARRIAFDDAFAQLIPRATRSFVSLISRPASASWLLALFALFILSTPDARAAAPRYSFAVIAGTMTGSGDEAPTQRLIDAIGRERDLSFIVYDGNLKGAKEACRDSLYERRHVVLDTSRVPLVFVPGQHDWTDCGSTEAGSFDPVERLDLLRQTLFSDPTSLGLTTVNLTRESEVARFHQYRENVRWQSDDTVFVGLNAPGPNNHYLSAGGRNGEFEDRVIANAFWLEHAAEYAKRRDARALVIFMQGDPDPERYERPERFAWLRFGRNTRRDGYLELKRTMVKVAEIFHGPVVLIHCDDDHAPKGFLIDQPLRNDKGAVVTNLTRIALAPHERLSQWIQIDVDLARRPPFRVSVHDVPKNVPLPPMLPQPSRELPGSAPAMPEVPNLSPASELPPILPTPPAPSQQDMPNSPPVNGDAPASSGAPSGY